VAFILRAAYVGADFHFATGRYPTRRQAEREKALLIEEAASCGYRVVVEIEEDEPKAEGAQPAAPPAAHFAAGEA